jgi:hypothetical protein
MTRCYLHVGLYTQLPPTEKVSAREHIELIEGKGLPEPEAPKIFSKKSF